MITEENGVFHIRTDTYSYLFKIDAYGLPEHLHFGAPVKTRDAGALSCRPGLGWGASILLDAKDTASCPDVLPLEWSGREGKWTWLLRASVSFSSSSSNAMDYFPTDPRLQAQANALGRSAVYTGGSSTGFGRSLRAVVEHQLTSNLALGAQFEMDRSAYYAPSSLMLYARFLLDPVTAPLVNRPRPVQPYSSF